MRPSLSGPAGSACASGGGGAAQEHRHLVTIARILDPEFPQQHRGRRHFDAQHPEHQVAAVYNRVRSSAVLSSAAYAKALRESLLSSRSTDVEIRGLGRGTSSVDSFASHLFGASAGSLFRKYGTLAQQAKQQVLRLDVRRAKFAGLKAGKEDDAARLFCVPFKHAKA